MEKKMKHTIEVEGLPEGWEAVAYRNPIDKDETILYDGKPTSPKGLMNRPWLIIKTKQPRRIVLEETDEENYRYVSGQYKSYNAGEFILSGTRYVWREVKGTDLSLTNVDDKESLRLSVDECKEAMRKLETFNVTDLSVKICRFLKDK